MNPRPRAGAVLGELIGGGDVFRLSVEVPDDQIILVDLRTCELIDLQLGRVLSVSHFADGSVGLPSGKI
jgi:hypothetical protein